MLEQARVIRTKPEAYFIKKGALIGSRTVLSDAFSTEKDPSGNLIWKFLVECSCGQIDVVRAAALRRGDSSRCLSCGFEAGGVSRITHGDSRTKLYGVWKGMIQRCSDPNYKQWEDYGGRGITVCEEWMSYLNFRSWAHSNGYQEGYDLHREKNDLGYSPENCGWLLREEHRRLHGFKIVS